MFDCIRQKLLKTSVLATTIFAIANTPSAQAENDDFKFKILEQAKASLAKHHVPGAAISVLQDGEISWIQGVGFADKTLKSPVTEDTVFNVGSISKSVAAWGFMKMVESGSVSLDDPIEDHMTRWSFPDSVYDSKEITLRRLLSHSAGLSVGGYPGIDDASKLPNLVESLSGNGSEASKVFIKIAPGSQYEYSGGGYTVAQLLLEEKTGVRFSEYMKEEVLLPLGMQSSNFGWTGAAGAATPYDSEGNPIPPVRFTELAAAGLETNCIDLSLFAAETLRASAPYNVLKKDTIDLMLKKESPADGARSAGLGYQQMQFGPFHVVGHLGSNKGWEAAMLLKPETGDGLVILTNGSNGANVARSIFRIWAQSLSN